MPKIADIYNLIDKFAPFNTQLRFDNAGLLIGDMSDNVTKIAISLDATLSTIKIAHKNGCDLLITHHPIIFSSLKSLSSYDLAYYAVKYGVSVISAHTNADAAKGGVNDCLAEKIGLVEIKELSNGDDIVPMARLGKIKTKSILSAKYYAEILKELIGCGAIKLTEGNKNISTVAVCGGAGGDYITAAANAGADALVTGECKHHERLLAKQLGISLFECGHFCTEQFVKKALYNLIKPNLNDVMIIDESDPAIYI